MIPSSPSEYEQLVQAVDATRASEGSRVARFDKRLTNVLLFWVYTPKLVFFDIPRLLFWGALKFGLLPLLSRFQSR